MYDNDLDNNPHNIPIYYKIKPLPSVGTLQQRSGFIQNKSRLAARKNFNNIIKKYEMKHEQIMKGADDGGDQKENQMEKLFKNVLKMQA